MDVKVAKVDVLGTNLNKLTNENLALVRGFRYYKNMTSKKSELLKLLNIGPRSAMWLESVGIKSVDSFMKYSPESIYEKLNKKHKRVFHPAFLYVIRAAQFYEKNRDKRAHALMWWLFKETKKRVY